MDYVFAALTSLLVLVLKALTSEYQKSTFALIESFIIFGMIWRNRSKGNSLLSIIKSWFKKSPTIVASSK